MGLELTPLTDKELDAKTPLSQ